MNSLNKIFENISGSYSNPVLTTKVIVSVLLVVLILCVYEFAVYRLVSHRSFYNKSFNICISILPFFISTIILCLQSNIVITLGTIGALAIIRFRTAIKDPVDMLYLLWSIHIGIVCGCQLYEVAVLTSIVVTVVLLAMENLNFGRRPLILVVHCDDEQEKSLFRAIESHTKRYRVKSRNYTGKGIDFVVEISVKDVAQLAEEIKKTEVEKFSIIEYDSDDVL